MENYPLSEFPEYDSSEIRNGRSDEIYKEESLAIELSLNKGFFPVSSYFGKNNDWEVRCMECEDIFITSFAKIKTKSFECKKCARSRKILLANNPSNEAFSIMAEKFLEPLEPFSGNSADRWKSKCLKCGALCQPRLYDLMRGKGGCKDCGQRSHLTEEYLLKIAEAMREAHLEPLEPFNSTDATWKSLCLDCGRTVSPRFANIKQGHGGCIYCQEHAFKHNKEAYFYIMRHSAWGALKVGVGNPQSKPDRIKSHMKSGWKLIFKYSFLLGSDAIALEAEILSWLRKDKKLPSFVSKELMKNAGHSETVDEAAISAIEIKNKVDEIIKQKRLKPTKVS